MKNLKRPDQSELDAMSHAELCGLIMRLFDVQEDLENRLATVEKNRFFLRRWFCIDYASNTF